MSDRPRIGVTRWEDVPGEAVDRYWTRVTESGAEVIDFSEQTAPAAPALTSTLDALLLTGGIDVDPAVYGAAERHPKVREVSRERDEFEIGCLRAALERDIPVLAICRGHQLLNVAFGGSLVQHIESGEHRADYRTEGYPSRWHDLLIEPDTRLAASLGASRLEINSRHHQAVTAGTLAPGLRPVAWAADHGRDLIEGIESESHAWVVGVQWHPERLEDHKPAFAPTMRRLFAAFIEQTRHAR
jgi:putative glutamine amidotransferase